MNSGRLTPEHVLAACNDAGIGHEPVTTSEVAAELGCSRQVALTKLGELAEQGELRSKTIGTQGRIWWRPASLESVDDRASNSDYTLPDTVLAPTSVALTESLSNATQHKHLETELKEVFDRVTDPFYALNDQWEFTHVNERAEELIDYQDESLVGKNFWDVLAWTENSKLGEEYRTAMETQEPTSFEFYYPAPLEAWYEVHAYPSETGLSVYFHDITERKERQQALEEYRYNYRTFVEHFPNGAVALVDEDLRYITFGGTPIDGTEMTRADLEGALLSDALPQDMADFVAPHYEAALNGETTTFEHSIGETVYQFHFVPVRDDDGNVFAALGMSQDVTERRESQRRLKESERRYRTLAEHFPSGAVGVYDHDLRYTLAHGAAVGNTLPTREQVEGKSIAEVFPEDTFVDLEPLYRAAIDDGKTGSTLTEFYGRYWRVWATPLHNADDEIFAGLTFAQDITEQVEREQQLEATIEKLEESNERLDSFASMLAHELRNPVTIGQIYSQQLPAEMGADAVEYVREAFDRIEDMVDVMLVLTRGREAVGEHTSVQLADVARNVWTDVDAPDAHLEVEIDRRIEADKTYIQHLFRNLFENAVVHGGQDVTITVGNLSTGFYVADDGPGIPVDDRDAVFEAGYTTTAEEGGTGLGLAFVKELADVYEWECSVTESAMNGAQINFRSVN